MDNRQSVCANIPPVLFRQLEKEVTNNGMAAINNRRNMAKGLRGKAAESVKLEAEAMLEIAERNGIKLT